MYCGYYSPFIACLKNGKTASQSYGGFMNKRHAANFEHIWLIGHAYDWHTAETFAFGMLYGVLAETGRDAPILDEYRFLIKIIHYFRAQSR